MNLEQGIRFRSNIDIAIHIITKIEGSPDDEEILEALFTEMDRNDAVEILIFLPIAFCRLMLPNIDFLDEYYVSTRGGAEQALRKFTETIPYRMSLESATKYFSTRPGRENILKIAGRSSEFHAINTLLNNGGDLNDIKLTRMNIIW